MNIREQLERTSIAVLDRIVEMERLAIPEALEVYKHWIAWNKEVPYWINRIAGFTGSIEDGFELSIDMALVLAHISSAGKVDEETDNLTPQVRSWLWIPRVIGFFLEHPTLEVPNFDRMYNIDPYGLSINSENGMDVYAVQGRSFTTLTLRFDLSVPIQISGGYDDD